jgi:GNAT superfamily N-acetyltransferase
MEKEFKVIFSPTESDLREIEKWLIDEMNKTDEGFYCNWNIIEDSFHSHELYILKSGNKSIGFISWSDLDEYFAIDIMEIKPNYRKKGIGSYFFKKVETELKKTNKLAIKLFCEPRSSIYFWRKQEFIQFPYRDYSEHELTLYKPLIETTKMTNSPDNLNKLELWDVEPHLADRHTPRWCWNIELNEGILKNPILQVCNPNWNLCWTKNGKIVKQDKVKYFSNHENNIYISPFMYITKLK